MGKTLQGRRRADTVETDLPSDIQPGDYWKILNVDGTPKRSASPSNLTTFCWLIAPIVIGDDAYALGNLTNHTVREHEDGTISVRPSDGSSNSILVTRRPGETWHGYVNHGVLEEC